MEYIIYKGIRFTVQQGYYRASVQLHREIWKEHYGDIPQDHQIHHKNGIKTDNRIENLECIPVSEHRKVHNAQKEVRYQVCKLDSRLSLRKKRAWYLLKSGKNIKSENSKIFWDQRKEKTCICIICGTQYSTRSVKTKNGCCSNACRCYLYRVRKAGLYHDVVSPINR